ncbi:MAG: 3-demethylubiquinone-9 3-methyltransferase [Candidatus Synechococcus spongiarum 15L]|uniref:3-demethylubiquinone-9 3-methyltransferase n=1 Tax=Candidatus Synechococcus spongiarum 15L TaxID=1608419 RepID=A0A0G8AXS7_9SYNE|nr:MAG: 3-demethylubiquinone-9 3-methyltransferase [Candidatus Synechococcus spongiarum 15L]MCY4366262.1 VOC family protein [Chloroflexota bacterium]
MAEFQKITPFLWFDGRAQEAAALYVSLFPDSRVVSISPLEAGPAEGAALVSLVLAGQEFTALDGGPMFQFSPAISFVVNCETQEEIDHYWQGLSEGGTSEQCGWLKDKFGVSWQIVPAALGDLMEANPEPVMTALLSMEKIDLAALESAARGE